MIVYYLGLPGSGKTYCAVNVIYNNFSNNKDAKKDLKKNYENCYTNINEFKFNLVHDVYRFDYDVFFKNIFLLYSMYKKKASDDELIVKAKELNIYKTLFIIDECHNYFDVLKPELIWWLTYHRHLYHDIYLITQNIQLINAKYKPLAEAFYKAKSQSLTLDKRYFNYMYYTESRMSKSSFVNTVKVKKNQNVFKLYQSGDSVKSQNVVLRFVIISLIIFFVLLMSGYFMYQHFVPETSKTYIDNKEKVVHKNSSPSVPDDSDSDSSDGYDLDSITYLKFVCTDEMCTYKDLYFDIKILAFARENFGLEIISSKRVFSQTFVTVVVQRNFVNFLQGGDNVSAVSDSIGLFESK